MNHHQQQVAGRGIAVIVSLHGNEDSIRKIIFPPPTPPEASQDFSLPPPSSPLTIARFTRDFVEENMKLGWLKSALEMSLGHGHQNKGVFEIAI